MTNFKIWLEATRPKTLIASFAPVFLGTALASQVTEVNFLPSTICLGFALLVQVGTNFANDYYDGIKGTDTDERLGPRRAVASGLISAKKMKWAAICMLVIAFFLGLNLITLGGWWLLAVGVTSVVCAWLYTGGPYPLAYNGLGDIFVVIFFGLVAVGCTYYLQTTKLTIDCVLLGLSCGLLVNNILIVNNYRDVEVDCKVGKRTLVVMLGKRWALTQFFVSLLTSGIVLSWLALSGYGFWILIGWLPILFGLKSTKKLATANDAETYSRIFEGAILVICGYSLLVSLCLFSFDSKLN